MTIIQEIAAERRRQIEVEHNFAAYDDRYTRGELALAAASYAISATRSAHQQLIALIWPWAEHWWKPKTPRRDLIRAGALIVAEIERIDRADAKARETEPHG